MSFYGNGSSTKHHFGDNPFLAVKQTDLFRSLQHHHQNTKKALETWRRCVMCQENFQLKTMGNWECRYHPGRPTDYGREIRYTCCSHLYDAYSLEVQKGCTRCDHSEMNWNKVSRPITMVPLFAVEWIQTPPEYAQAIPPLTTNLTFIEFRSRADVVEQLEDQYQSVLEKNHIKLDRTDFFRTHSEY